MLGMQPGSFDAMTELLPVSAMAQFYGKLPAFWGEEDIELLSIFERADLPLSACLILILYLLQAVNGVDDPVGGQGPAKRRDQAFRSKTLRPANLNKPRLGRTDQYQGKQHWKGGQHQRRSWEKVVRQTLGGPPSQGE